MNRLSWPCGRDPMERMGVTRRELRGTFRSPVLSDRAVYRITGVTKDSTGAVLGNCIVRLFYTRDDSLASIVESDANGNFTFMVGPSLQCYAVAYKVGGPDVSGVTVNTLVGV